ncbi:uncharacterized protein UTRI_03608 [Ustilago trichophora]|uniref:Uncharacterized protein n=1 Tax=Ustilago trichophora TaxID=86804 RepID=A0A5C3E2N6_9BASI|nr:uncharacterized protein UTRI_03608 [Ustilago trichophora]
MPPKKLSISRIRADSRVRSDDPDLNRSSSRRTNASASSSRPSQRFRPTSSFASSSSSPSARGARSNATIAKRSRRPPQPKTSARILHVLDDDIEETRVQNLFAPDSRTQRQNVSYRPLTLTQQARRDGAAFRIPSLGSMCCSVIASCFDALLPSREQFDAATIPSTSSGKIIRNSHTSKKSSATRKRSRARAFGAAPDSDEDQQDYIPSDDDISAPKTSSRSTRSRRDTSEIKSTSNTASGSSQLLAGWTTSELHYLTRKTSEQLKRLSPAASFLLFKALVEQSPQYLTKYVVSTYFLPPILNPSSNGAVNTAARTHVWLPASIPLLSHDKSAASNLVSHLTSALSSARKHHPSVLSQATAEEMPLAALPSRLVLAQPASFALRSLQLHGLTRLQDASIARFFEAALPSATASSSASNDTILRLETVSLRGCIAVSDRTVSAMCRSTGSTLRYLNLDFTDVSADSVTMIMMLVPNLETLKLGYNDNLSDKTLQVALQAPYSGSLPFSKLANLRLRQCSQVGDVGVACFLKYAYKTLEVLDISGTSVGGTHPHNSDFNILLMSFFPSGLPGLSLSEPKGRIDLSPTNLPLRKLNLLDTNLDYDSLIKIVDRAPNMDTLLLRQMPSRTTYDGMIHLLEKLTSLSQAANWLSRPWKRLHLRILDVGDEFADLFPRLLAIFPRLHVESLKSSQSQTSFFYDVPDRLEPSTAIVQHLKLPDARLSEHAWQFLPLITSLHTLDLSNTAVPGTFDASEVTSFPSINDDIG